MFETRERFAALIALTFEQATDIMDSFIKQVDAIAAANPANPANSQSLRQIDANVVHISHAPACANPVQEVVAEKPVEMEQVKEIAILSPPPPPPAPRGVAAYSHQEDFIPDYDNFPDFREDFPLLSSPPRSPSPPPPQQQTVRISNIIKGFQQQKRTAPPPIEPIDLCTSSSESEEESYVCDDDEGVVPDSAPVPLYTAEEYGDGKLPDEDEVEAAEREIRRQKAKQKKREKREREKEEKEEKASRPRPPGPAEPGRRGRYPLRSNPKKTRIYSDADYNHQKENDPGEDLFGDEHSSSAEERRAHGEKERLGQANDVEDLRDLLCQIHGDEKAESSLIQHLDRNLWGRTQFLVPLKEVRYGLGHDDKRNLPAKQLFDKIMNDADPHSVRENVLSGRTKVKCALCCIEHHCPNFVQFEGERIKYPLANYCIQIASSLGDFCHYLKLLADQMPDRAGPNELKLLNQKFENVLIAHANKQNKK